MGAQSQDTASSTAGDNSGSNVDPVIAAMAAAVAYNGYNSNSNSNNDNDNDDHDNGSRNDNNNNNNNNNNDSGDSSSADTNDNRTRNVEERNSNKNTHEHDGSQGLGNVEAAAITTIDHSGLDKNSQEQFQKEVQLQSRVRPRHGNKLGARKRNWCWNWFTQEDPRDKNVATCDYCGRLIRRMPSDKGSPKKLLEHLNTHKITPDMANPKRKIETANFEQTRETQYTAGVQSFYNTINKRKRNPRSKMESGYHDETQSGTAATDPNIDATIGEEPSSAVEHKGTIDANASAVTTATNAVAASSSHENVQQRTFNAVDFANLMLDFLSENRVSIDLILSSSFGDILNRREDKGVDGVLREIAQIYGSGGTSADLAVLNYLMRLADRRV